MSDDTNIQKDNHWLEIGLLPEIIFCTIIITFLSIIIITPTQEISIIFKYIGIACLTFVSITLFIDIKQKIDKRNREILIGEIRKLLK